MNQKLFLATVTALSIVLSASVYNTFTGGYGTRSLSDKAIPTNLHTLYSKWKATHGKIYSGPSESFFRLKEFFRTFKLLQRMRVDNPDGVYKLNHLSDTTDEEFLAKYATKKSTKEESQQPPEKPPQSPNLKQINESHLSLSHMSLGNYNLDRLDKAHPLPDQVNNLGRLGQLHRSQGVSSTCYSFALARAVEGELNSKFHHIVVSSQQFVNCSPSQCKGNFSQGANPICVAVLVLENSGYATEEEVPFVGYSNPFKNTNEKCHLRGKDKGEFEITLADGKSLKKEYYDTKNNFSPYLRANILNDAVDDVIKYKDKEYPYKRIQITPYWLKKRLSEKHILLADIHISGVFKILTQGTAYNSKDCKADTTNHSVALVGYSNSDWIMVNSWTEKLGNGDFSTFKIAWRSNFFADEIGNCFCGGIGTECSSILIRHKNNDNPMIPVFVKKEQKKEIGKARMAGGARVSAKKDRNKSKKHKLSKTTF